MVVATECVSSVKVPPTATVFSPDRDRVFPRPRPCFPPTATVLVEDESRQGRLWSGERCLLKSLLSESKGALFPPTATVLSVSWRAWRILLLICGGEPVEHDVSVENFPPTATVLGQKRCPRVASSPLLGERPDALVRPVGGKFPRPRLVRVRAVTWPVGLQGGRKEGRLSWCEECDNASPSLQAAGGSTRKPATPQSTWVSLYQGD